MFAGGADTEVLSVLTAHILTVRVTVAAALLAIRRMSGNEQQCVVKYSILIAHAVK